MRGVLHRHLFKFFVPESSIKAGRRFQGRCSIDFAIKIEVRHRRGLNLETAIGDLNGQNVKY
jgi:hypothetical protein